MTLMEGSSRFRHRFRDRKVISTLKQFISTHSIKPAIRAKKSSPHDISCDNTQLEKKNRKQKRYSPTVIQWAITKKQRGRTSVF